MPFELELWRRHAEQTIFGDGAKPVLPGGPNNDPTNTLRVSLRRLPGTMSGKLRKPHTLMRPRPWPGQMLVNVRCCHERYHPEA